MGVFVSNHLKYISRSDLSVNGGIKSVLIELFRGRYFVDVFIDSQYLHFLKAFSLNVTVA